MPVPIRLLLAGPDERALARSAYPALTAAGFQVLAIVDSPTKLRDAAAVADVDLIIVEAQLTPSPEDALALLGDLGDVALAVVLPPAWAPERERFSGLPSLVAGFTAPVSWPNVAVELANRLRQGEAAEEGDDDESQRTKVPSPPVARVEARPAGQESTPAASAAHGGRSVRLAFYGTRGGAGTSTAALRAAQALAASGRRVALFDSRVRGDLHLMSGIAPELVNQLRETGHSVTQNGVTLHLGPPSEELARGFDATVVDGGREQGGFNADWIPVNKHLSEQHIAHLVGAMTSPGSTDSLTLGPLSIEVRD